MLLLDPFNPVKRDHPLNRDRVAWWYTPYGLNNFTPSSRVLRDLLKSYDGTLNDGINATIDYRRGDEVSPELFITGSDSANVNFGNVLDYTGSFTVGCDFQTSTLAPSGFGGGAILVGKNAGSGSLGWWLAQTNDTLQFGGDDDIVSGSVLALGTRYRVVAVSNGASSSIYLNGVEVATGTHSAGSTSENLRIGFGIDNWTWSFKGWISDCFVANRVWSASEAKWDYDLWLRKYRGSDSPLNWIKLNRAIPSLSSVPVEFTTGITVGGPFLFATPANFTTELGAFASSGGIGDLDAEGTPEFITSVGILTPFAAGEPTLVNLRTDVTVGDTLQASDPALFTTTVECGQSLRTIPNGDRRIISQKRYRR